jgi:ABC-2 type transport system permease protein
LVARARQREIVAGAAAWPSLSANAQFNHTQLRQNVIWAALILGVVLYITASLALGFLISTIARTQRDAQLMAQFYFMPSILLSGFLFPFVGMPQWAQVLGSLVPVTHFLRIARGSPLKGQGLADDWSSLAALGLFTIAVSVLAILRYRTTLD